jgi:alcohol dehydrogenase class IV
MRGRVFVGGNALSDVFALRAIERIGRSLARAVADERHAREEMLLGSLCAGLAFATAGTALAHALQYPVGASTRTPHGLGVGLLLPFVMAFNAAAVPDRMGVIARSLGAGDDARAAIAAVAALGAEVGVPASLAEIGLDAAALPAIAEQAIGIRRLIDNNPRPVDRDGARLVLEQALAGGPLQLLTS